MSEHIIHLHGGPRNGEEEKVDDPWPRSQLVVDDGKGGSATYYVRETEPEQADYVASPSSELEADPAPFGPAGPPGDQGPVGPEGPEGKEGPPGTGIIFRGLYGNGLTYALNDAVVEGNALWISKAAENVGHKPDEDKGAHWERSLSGFNPRGAFVITDEYNLLDVVSEGGAAYVCQENNVIGAKPSTHPETWVKLVEGVAGAEGPPGPEGKPGKEPGAPAGIAQIHGETPLIGAAPGTNHKLAVNVVDWDISGWWDAENHRYVPKQAGTYLVCVAFQGTEGVNSGSFTDVVAYKNGEPLPQCYSRQQSDNSGYGPEGGGVGLVQMNGTTDYLEIWGGTPSSAFGGSSEITGLAFLGVSLQVASSGDKTLEFKQEEAEEEWKIVHNLDKFPCVQVFDTEGEQWTGEIHHVSDKELTIKFTPALAGVAYLN